MSNKTEYFNAKCAGHYLGDQWVVRGSDFDRVERQRSELIDALRECVNNPYSVSRRARTLLTELENQS